MRSSKILDPWFYDQVINEEKALLDHFHKNDDRVSRDEKEIIGLLEQHKLKPFLKPDYHEYLLKKLRDIQERRPYHESGNRHVADRITQLTESKPFLIGAATLESLVNREPDTYEYIEGGKLPFDNMFFEFAEPFSMNIPFWSQQSSARGIQLMKSVDPETKKMDYCFILYYVQQNKILAELSIHTDFVNLQVLGRLRYNDKRISSKDRIFTIDPTSRTVKYTEDVESAQKLYVRDPNKALEALGITTSISQIPYNEVFYQIPNLCTNLINYINAHNVTVVKKDRPIIILDIYDDGRKKKSTKNTPFYLVTVRDMLYVEPDEPREVGKWVLEERIYVKGHNRKYLNPDQSLRLKIWIRPCVKGPLNAPWRNQRYEVLYEKLKREKEMYRKFGIDQ